MPTHPLPADLAARVISTLTAGIEAVDHLDSDHMFDGDPDRDRDLMRRALDRAASVSEGDVYALDRAEELCRIVELQHERVADEVADLIVADMTIDDVYEQHMQAEESYGEMLAENGSSALYGLGYSAADAMSAAYMVTPRPEDSALYRALRRRIDLAAPAVPQDTSPRPAADPDDIPF